MDRDKNIKEAISLLERLPEEERLAYLARLRQIAGKLSCGERLPLKGASPDT